MDNSEQIDAALAIQNAGGTQGRRISLTAAAAAVPDLVLTGPSSKTITLNQAALKTAGVAMIGVFHHPDDIVHLVDREVVLHPREIGHVAQ